MDDFHIEGKNLFDYQDLDALATDVQALRELVRQTGEGVTGGLSLGRGLNAQSGAYEIRYHRQ